jgi:hypothetical protein
VAPRLPTVIVTRAKPFKGTITANGMTRVAEAPARTR